jgi:putative PIN family toxin of toxin-antitoxin system
MRIKSKKIKVFLDSSLIIAGLASSRGGSREVLLLAELGVIIPVISEQVVTEVLRNLERKVPQCLPEFYALFKILPLMMAPEPSKEIRTKAHSLLNPADAEILAAALSAEADWLLSLDKHFLDSNLEKELLLRIASPGIFLQHLFPGAD